MTTLIQLQLSQEEFRDEIKKCISESIAELREIPILPQQLPPDRIYLKGACEVTNQSEAQIYKMTMLQEIPFEKFGKRLVFSRKKLVDWMEDRTISPNSARNLVENNLVKAAKKHLKK